LEAGGPFDNVRGESMLTGDGNQIPVEERLNISAHFVVPCHLVTKFVSFLDEKRKASSK